MAGSAPEQKGSTNVGQKVIGVAGFKNSGKTTLVEKLVSHLTGLGYRISTVKHAHHSFDIDHEGRDSFRHRKAGATEVAVISHEDTSARAVVIGGGVVGVGTLYHLAKKGWSDVVLIERKELTSGSTWHAAGLLPLFNLSYSVGQIHKYSVRFYQELEKPKPASMSASARSPTSASPAPRTAGTSSCITPASPKPSASRSTC
jgi:hypothetical protein